MVILILWSNFFLVPPEPPEQVADSTMTEPVAEIEPERFDEPETKPISIAPTDTSISISDEPEKVITVETFFSCYPRIKTKC